MMLKVIIIYYSRTGNTAKMAHAVAQGIEKEGLSAQVKKVEDASPADLLKYDAIVIGSPTYYGTMAAEIKKLFDDTVEFHGQLEGKAGAAFSSSANIGGGNETTILDILKAMLIHGMVIQGDSVGDHYGPVSIDEPDDRCAKYCVRFGQRVALLAKRLAK
jgi:NAD(P)H dehydrogenase (quinone)